MPAPVVIDLGELPRGQQPEPDPAWPFRERLRRLRGHRGARMIGVALVVTLVLATANAGSLLRSPLTLQFAVGDATVAYADQQNLYVVRESGPAVEINLAAYRLDDGALRWETSLAGSRESLWLLRQDGALLASASPTDLAGEWQERATRIDPDSGEQLWTHEGWMTDAGHGRLLLTRQLPTVWQEEDGELTYREEYAAQEVTAVDLATGRPEWSIQIKGRDTALVDSDPPRLVTLSPEGGELTSYDLATGELLTTTAAIEDIQPDMQRALSVIESMVLVSAHRGGQPVIAAYDGASLTHQWTEQAASGDFVVFPQSCGPVICLSGDGELRALDPATGETAWSPGWVPVSEDRGYVELYDPGVRQLADHVVVRWDGGGDGSASWLVDAESGEPVLELGAWSLDLYFWWALQDDPAAIPVLRIEDGSTWVGRLRPDLSGVDPLMALDTDYPDSCRALPPYVVCGRDAWSGDDPGRVEVWRVG